MVKSVVGRYARTGGAVRKCAAEWREEDGFVLPEGSLILAFPRPQWEEGGSKKCKKISPLFGGKNLFSCFPFFSPFRIELTPWRVPSHAASGNLVRSGMKQPHRSSDSAEEKARHFHFLRPRFSDSLGPFRSCASPALFSVLLAEPPDPLDLSIRTTPDAQSRPCLTFPSIPFS